MDSMKIISIKSIISLVAAAAFVTVACNKTFELDLPLAVSSRVLDLEADAGSTHILVYSDGDWSAKFAEPVEWASLDRLNGTGNSEIVLTYAANYGVSRRLKIALAKGELRDTIAINQKGQISEPQLAIACDSLSFCRTAGAAAVSISSNLYYSLQNVAYDVIWEEDEKDWISDISFDGRKLCLSVSENTSGQRRRAFVDFNVQMPGDSETEDKTETFRFLVSQSPADASLVLGEPALALQSGKAGTLVLSAAENDVWDYSEGVSFNVAYSPEVSGEESWVSDIKLSDKELVCKLKDNMSGEERSATIQVLFNGVVIAEKAITQDLYPVIVEFDKLRAYPLGELTSKEFIEGYVISEHGSENICQNPQTGQFKFDLSENSRTAIVESLDGKYGFQLKFTDASDNSLQRYSRVRINLKGLTLSKQDEPECYTLSGCRAENLVEALEPTPEAIPSKMLQVSELSDTDIYTLVSLVNMEIVFKDGAFTNCTDGYSLKTSFNPSGTTSPRWDVAPLLLTDDTGSTISMLTNSNVEWRRDGKGVNQGSGIYTGVIVAETLVRYGDIGRYQIRPMVRQDIALDNEPFSRTLVEWNWNDAKGDAIPEIGEGSISGVSITPSADYNALIPNNLNTSINKPFTASSNNGKGVVNNMAAYFSSTWTVGASFDVSFSTAGVSGTNLQFGFTWGHGKMNNTSLGVPSHWTLLYSVDGGNSFKEFVPLVKSRAITWWTTTPVDTAPGYIGHMFKMPDECFGKEEVIVRFQVKDNVRDIDPKSSASNWATALAIEKGTFTSCSDPLRFGTITVRYN